jgi:hypothetical protein
MGLFNKTAPLDPRFTLPSVKKMDCTQLIFPCKSEVAMMNFRWIDKRMSSGKYQDPMMMVSRILETSDFWKEIDVVNLDNSTNALVQYVMSI